MSIKYFDIMALDRLNRDPELELRLFVWDGALYLLVSRAGVPLLLANPEGRELQNPMTRNPQNTQADDLEDFKRRRFALFQWEAAQ